MLGLLISHFHPNYVIITNIMPYIGSYVWKVREKFGSGLLLLPAASVVVEREDGAILMMKRTDGNYSIIGGYAEEGAGFTDTALTELREEAAMEGAKSDLIPFATLSDPLKNTGRYPNGHEVQVFAQCFILRKWQQLNQALDETEVVELLFIQPNEISDDMPMSDVTREELAAYKAYLETGEYQVRG